MKRAVLVLAVIGSMAGISGSTAELDPPWRGAPGSTYQEWRFDNNANPAAPDLKTNVASAGQAEITLGAFAAGWQQQLPGLGSATGYWDLGSRSEEHTSELQSPTKIVCRLLLEKKKKTRIRTQSKRSQAMEGIRTSDI